jgi:hypothetical protein
VSSKLARCAVAGLVAGTLLVGLSSCDPEHPAPPARQRVTAITFLGSTTFATGTQFERTPVGGLSGLTYDAKNGRYYSISDDRSEKAPARFYTLSIDVADGKLDAGDVAIKAVTTLRDATGSPFPARSTDTEAIALSSSGTTVFVSSEGDADAGVAPFVREFGLADGRQVAELPIATRYLPAPAAGIRDNLAFESLARSPDGKTLVTATENALKQDGPSSSETDASPSRMLFFDLATRKAAREAIYLVESGGFGLVELAALDDRGTLLALERSYAPGVGNTIQLFEVRTEGARDVSGLDTLVVDGKPSIDGAVEKRRLLDVRADTPVAPDNLEAMALGPTLADGRRLLVMASDDNFNPKQVTQFLAFALKIEAAP